MTPIENLNLWTTANDLTGDTLRAWGQKINDNFAIVQSDTAQVQTNLDDHEADTTNPHSVTKTQVGLSNVDNTSDLNKPVSTATQSALDTKQDTSEKGVANWYAELDWTGKVPSSQLPDAGLWDMLKGTYDPNFVEWDAFSMDNMVEGTDTKILTEAERTKLTSVEANAQENTINDVVAGTNITIDKTDPLNPVFNASWWIAPVDSVNWETGVVVLDTDDILEGTNKYVSQSDKDKLAWIEANADVTDSVNVDSAGAVMESDYSQAKSILAQQSGTWSPEVVQVGSNELVGRTSGGASNIGSLSASEVRTILNVEDGATADQTASEIKTAYESNADTNVFTDAEKTNLGNQSGTNTWDQDLSGYVQYSDTTKTFTGTGDTSFAGNVWIGTTSPWSKLHINWWATSSGWVTIQNWWGNDDLKLIWNQGNVYARFLEEWVTDPWRFQLLNSWAVQVDIRTNGSTYFNWGNVWIWTATPTDMLHVSWVSTTRWVIENRGTWEANLELRSDLQNARLFYRKSDGNFGIYMPLQDWTWLRTVLRIKWNHDVILDSWATAKVWVGIYTPISRFHVYENNSNAGISQWIIVEQDGAWDATLQFLRTWIRRTIMGVDGSDNKFKISTWSQWLSLWNILTLDTAWNMGLWNLTSPTKKLHVSGTSGYLADTDMWTDDTDFAHKKYVDNRQVIEYSWRWYMYAWNAWRTSSNNSYWPNYYQWSSSAWSGVNPVVSWTGLWSWVRAGQKIKRITISWVRRSSAELTDIEFAINHRSPNGSNSWENWIDATSEVVNSTLFKEDSFMNSSIAWQPQFNWDLSDMHSRTYEVDLEILEDGFLDFCWKPIWVLTTTRFAYINYKIDLN